MNMYLLNEIKCNAHIHSYGNYIEVKKSNYMYMLEIEIFKNSSQKLLGVQKGDI